MSLPTGFAQTTFASGIGAPTAMAFAPDGRLFVTEQDGDVRVITRDGRLLPEPFVHLDAFDNDEQGLIGIAFDPNFAQNGNLFLHYVPMDRRNMVVRVTADRANPDVAVAGSLTPIIKLPEEPGYGPNHQGGALAFGPDGKLYWTQGEHGHGAYSQDLEVPWGKILRINPDGSFPTDNPFYDSSTGWGRAVWAMGLRNPYTFAIEPGTGQMLINDVGGGLREEVNLGRPGANYGWPTTEGKFNPATFPQFTNPVYDMVTGDANISAIIGAAFYTPPTGAQNPFPASYAGKYFFSDYAGRFVRVLDPDNGYAMSVFATNNQLPPEMVDLEFGPDGSLYGLARGGGVVAKIEYTGSDAPVISSNPTSQTKTVGQSVTFIVSASGGEPLNYQWQRRNVGETQFRDIAGATSASYTIQSVAESDNGAQFRAVVTNGDGNAASALATLTVTANRPPSVTINTPADGSLYSAGNTINFSGTATDPEDGALPASAFRWFTVFHHDTHTHPFSSPVVGQTSGSFTIPTAGETSADVWYRIHLQVTDAEGLTTEVTRDVRPRTADVTLATSVPGMSLLLDGAPRAAPHTFTGVAGMVRQLTAPAAQTINGVSYEFVRWSDGGAADHTISTPAAATTYTAVYRPLMTVMGRYVFYNNSSFDGRNPAANTADDAAIATDKQALLPGQTATFANYTSYSNGINGIMLDVSNGGMPITANSFSLRVGNASGPAGWTVAPGQVLVTRRNGAGAGGSDRITLTWPDRLIRNKWIEVTFRPAPGEPPRDVFYFGNAVGETGTNPANAYVNALDQANVRSRLRSMANVVNRFDFNRDGRVNVVDQRIVRSNLASGARALALITPTPPPPEESATVVVSSASAPLFSTEYIRAASGVTSILRVP